MRKWFFVPVLLSLAAFLSLSVPAPRPVQATGLTFWGYIAFSVRCKISPTKTENQKYLSVVFPVCSDVNDLRIRHDAENQLQDIIATNCAGTPDVFAKTVRVVSRPDMAQEFREREKIALATTLFELEGSPDYSCK